MSFGCPPATTAWAAPQIVEISCTASRWPAVEQRHDMVLTFGREARLAMSGPWGEFELPADVLTVSATRSTSNYRIVAAGRAELAMPVKRSVKACYEEEHGRVPVAFEPGQINPRAARSCRASAPTEETTAHISVQIVLMGNEVVSLMAHRWRVGDEGQERELYGDASLPLWECKIGGEPGASTP